MTRNKWAIVAALVLGIAGGGAAVAVSAGNDSMAASAAPALPHAPAISGPRMVVRAQEVTADEASMEVAAEELRNAVSSPPAARWRWSCRISSMAERSNAMSGYAPRGKIPRRVRFKAQTAKSSISRRSLAVASPPPPAMTEC